MAYAYAPSHEQGEFNQSIAYLYRLDEILKSLNLTSFQKDYDSYFRMLNVYWRELKPMANNKDRKQHKEFKQKAQKAYQAYCEAKHKNQKTISLSILEDMHQWEEELRDLMQSKGLLMKKKADARFAIADNE